MLQVGHAADGGQVESVVAAEHRHVQQPAAADGAAGIAAGGHRPAPPPPPEAGCHPCSSLPATDTLIRNENAAAAAVAISCAARVYLASSYTSMQTCLYLA